MTIKFILRYFADSHKKLKKISEKGDGNIFYLWYDFIKCSIIHGAIINHYTRGGLYKLKGCERKKSMTYRRILKAFSKMNSPEAIEILNNKHLFNAHFAPFVKRKWLYSKEMSFDKFNDLCEIAPYIIAKPEDGVEGVGVKKISVPSDTKDRKKLYEQFSSKSYMIEEVITQHPEMIYGNTSVNTIRAHSIIDKNGEVHLFKMLFRVGVGNTVVDNYAQGGCVYEIHLETGRIISPSLKKNGEEVYIHPQTDVFMLGRKIPNWEIVTAAVKEAHAMLPGCRFIGWDVAVTPDGIELIEGNHNTDYEFLEFFGSKGWWSIIKQYI